MLRTVVHLRPGQVLQRLRYRWRRNRWERNSAAIDARYRERAAALPPVHWDHPGLARVAHYRRSARAEAEALANAAQVIDGRFGFLGRGESFGREIDWFRPDLDRGTRLWKTLLHEFGYAEDLARAAAATGEVFYRTRLFELARSWRTSAPIGCRDFALDAWNARAVATRLVHWAVAGQMLELHAGDPDADWLGREIGLHGLFLRDNLELDLRGNHLFRDAVGLVFANELTSGVPDALDWLESQVREQLLPDGCHEERAPLYHAICTQDLLEVRLLLGDAGPAWLDEALARASGFLASITLGDGEIPLLGDGWLGEVDTQALLLAVGQRIEPAAPEAPEHHSGLVALRSGPWRAVVRAGPHAPDEQMGHAHADLLSLEASRGPQRVITDTGTLLYDPGPERLRMRGTLAHNTLRIDGCEQLEVWSSFRAGRRGRARVLCRGELPDGRGGTWAWISASHDAYRWRPGRPMHHRLVAVGDAGLLLIDAVLGSGRHRIESQLHVHPGAVDVAVAALGPQAARTQPAPLHEHFGETREMTRLALELETRLPWWGGWRVGDIAGSSVEQEGPQDGVYRLLLGGGHPFELRWHPEATDPSRAVQIALPAPPQAAT